MMKKIKSNASTRSIISGLVLVILFTLTASICAKANGARRSIPVLIDSNGIWLDQYSEPMPTEKAEQFLKRNSRYAVEILNLNENPYYATSYQSESRSGMIDSLLAEVSRQDTDADELLYSTVLEDVIVSDAPSNTAFAKLFIHLRNNGAASDVAKLQEYCEKGKIKDYVSPEVTARHMFFWALATNIDLGKGAFSPQIPVVMSSEGTWLDQNGNPTIEEAANWFLYNNKAYAIRILCLNKNQYYLSTWQSPERLAYINDIQEDVLDIRRIKTGYELESDEYSWIVQENLPDVSVETLREWQTQLGSNLAADRIECLITYIGQDDSAVLQGEMADYIFWTTVSKITASGAYQW